MRQNILLSIFFLLFIFHPLLTFSQSKKTLKAHKKATKNLQLWENPHTQWNHVGTIKIDSFYIIPEEQKIEILLSNPASYLPYREGMLQTTINSLIESLGRKFKDYEIKVNSDGKSLDKLIPNYYRKSIEIDPKRDKASSKDRMPIVRNIHKDPPSHGLYNKNIALWHSHGWYYEAKLDRWEWQRARLYSTVEDLFPMTFVLPYLVPMLENAGANIFLPRERDTQQYEVIVDNDSSANGSEIAIHISETETIYNSGFLNKDTLLVGENPFKLGSHLRFHSSVSDDQYLEYLPKFPEDGEYAVYASYVQGEDNVSDAKYTVFHAGGTTSFLVNQKIGGGTWIYLGTFYFNRGISEEYGSVRLSTKSEENGWITADAIKFGGGMGNIARKPANELLPNQWSLKAGQKRQEGATQKSHPDQFALKMSQKPRYMEGARYYLQYAGFPDTLVYSLNEGKNDYNDDYQSRGEWVNYLMGAPYGPNLNRHAPGLNIPIDLSLAFHTDAGVTPADSIIGTLGIYSSIRDDGAFPNGQSKMVNRDLTDIIQSEIVHDIRRQFNPKWTRRGLWDKEYSEAWRPNVPSMLLELLSHQNLTDMSYGHDPRFKFAVSRAIYKGMLKFLAYQNNVAYVVQPLPVDHCSIIKTGDKSILFSWKPVLDSLENTSLPTHYKVYRRVGNLGFDNGIPIKGTSINLELDEYDQIYSYKVTAINAGGESFPSEILSAGITKTKSPTILVVNAFDRVSAPSILEKGNFAGLAYWDDEGVPDKFDIGYTGQQYDFNRESKWLDDDSPGWGASYGNMEGKLIPGNSFDNIFIHGQSILEAGYSFVSTSDEAFANPDYDFSPYSTIDLIFGKEKTTKTFSGELFKVFNEDMQKQIEEFTNDGGNVFASGAYISSDHKINKDTIAQKFAEDVLHFKWRTNHAARNGQVIATDNLDINFPGKLTFNTRYHPQIYKVEAPDGIEPAGEGALSAFRYNENNVSAGIAFNGKYKTVILGFPFEAILSETERNGLMKNVLAYFHK